MKKYYRIFILLFVLFFKKTNAQNLVPNASFEFFLECPDTSTIPFYVNLDSTWFQFNSSDYFNSCDATNYLGVPTNRFGYQNANFGNAYMGFIAYIGNIFGREYLEVELTNSLIANQTYYVQFYVSLSDTMQFAIEDIGALFTDTLFDPFPAPTYDWVSGIPQIENQPGNMLNDKINWTAVSGSFVANGGEKFLTIGNFKDDANTQTQHFGGTAPSTFGAYYYIDDVFVGTSPPVSIEDHKKETATTKLYPNPNTGNMFLECNLKDLESGNLIIYSITGEVVKEYYITPGTTKMNINAEFLKAGVYLYETRINGKTELKDKLIIIK
jgi:hypothetical protein